MKNRKKTRLHIYLFAIMIVSIVWVTVAAAAEPAELDEASIQAYLEKKEIADSGSCSKSMLLATIKTSCFINQQMS